MPTPERTIEDLRRFAESRGGRCLSTEYLGVFEKHDWRCGRGHEFRASPRLLIDAGYWCPQCFPSPAHLGGWNYDFHAQFDPLLAKFHAKS